MTVRSRKVLTRKYARSSGFWVLWAYCLVPTVSPSVQISVCKLEMLFSDNRPLLQHTSSLEMTKCSAQQTKQRGAHPLMPQIATSPEMHLHAKASRALGQNFGGTGHHWYQSVVFLFHPTLMVVWFLKICQDLFHIAVSSPTTIVLMPHLSPNNKYGAITRH